MVGADDTGEDGEEGRCDPPAEGVAEEVDLLFGVVVRPEGDTAEEEGPGGGERGVGMGAGQGVVVVEHGALELDVLAEERQVLDLFDFLLVAGVLSSKGRDVIDIPDVAALLDVLVAVDFGLLVRPLGKRLGMSPHSNLGGDVNQLEVRRHGLEVAFAFGIHLDLEHGIIVTRSVSLLHVYGGELLVGRVVWRRDIVCQKHRIGNDVTEANNISNLNALTFSALQRLDGQDLPVVIGIVMGVTGDLLSLG